MVKCEKFIPKSIEEIKTAAGGEKVVMALSGGVDSSVCAALAARAIGDNLIPIYIDTGLMRKGETERIRTIFGNIHLQIVDAGDEFLDALKGITDPEAKRKAIGERFIRVFEREAKKQGAKCLLQGTIYPDRIESEGGIKSHHNVGGMPLHMEFTKVIEPIRDLYKDEVREVAGALGLPKEIQHRMPFPGPGLAVRVLGEVTREKAAVIREANWIVEDELVEKYAPWQCFASARRPRYRGQGRQPDPRLDRCRESRELPGRDDGRPDQHPLRPPGKDRVENYRRYPERCPCCL